MSRRALARLMTLMSSSAPSAGGGGAAVKLGWVTDIHIGRGGGTYDTGEPQDAFASLAGKLTAGDYVIVSGDVTEDSTEAQYDSFAAQVSASGLSSMTLQVLPGNHDEGIGLIPDGSASDGPADYTEYDAAGYSRRWNFDAGAFRFIGFTSYIRRANNLPEAFGDVSDTDIAYAQTQTEAARAAGKIPILVTHFPLDADISNEIRDDSTPGRTPRTSLITLINDYHIPVILSGHRHTNFALQDLDGTDCVNVNGVCLAYSQAPNPPGFHVISISGRTLTFEYFNGRSPFALLGSDEVVCPAYDFTAPTVTSMTVGPSGDSVTIVLSEAVDFGSGGNGGFALTSDGGAVTLAYASGAGTSTLVYSTSRTILQTEALSNGSYTQPGSGVLDDYKNPLATFTGKTVTNNSTQTNSFAWYSVALDGNDRINRGGDLTGLSDGKQFYLSFWFKATADAQQSVLGTTDQKFHVELNTAGGALRVSAQNSGGSTILDLRTAGQYRDGSWHHVAISVDLTDTGKRHIYVDGASDLVAFTYTNDMMDLTPGDWSVGSRGDPFLQFSGKLSEFVFGSSYIDLSVGANLEKFRTSGGDPADILSNGLTPIIYLRNEVPDWQTNEGSGGGFTQNGTLVDGGVDKP